MTINIANFFVIFDEDDILYILVEFERDRISPRQSGKNGQSGAHELNCILFFNSKLKFENYDNYDKSYPMKRIPSLYDTFEIFAIFEILPIFEISNANFGQMTIFIAIFFCFFEFSVVENILV